MASVTNPQRPNRLLAFYAAFFVIFLYFPVFLIMIFSFNDGVYVSFPLTGVTLDWYVDLLNREPLKQAFWNSLKVASAACVLSTILAIPAAIALSRPRIFGKKALFGLMFLPLILPGLVLGIALLTLVTWLGLKLSLVTVTIGHVAICLPFAISVLLPRLEGGNLALTEASADLGEGPWWTFWRVTFPTIRLGILASLLATFSVSFDEFYMAFFLSGTDSTLPMYIWNQLRFPSELPPLLALATLVLVVSSVLVFISLRLARIGLPVRTGGIR
jgi:spermidine/putrescine transport system permease protein